MSIIKQLQNFLNDKPMNYYLENTKILDNFLETNLAAFEKHFTKPQLFLLIEFPFVSNNISILNAEEILNAIDIRQNQAYKNAKLADPKPCTCRYNLGCPGSSNDCNSSDSGCYSGDPNYSCGVFGGSSCTGRCGGIQPSHLD